MRFKNETDKERVLEGIIEARKKMCAVVDCSDVECENCWADLTFTDYRNVVEDIQVEEVPEVDWSKVEVDTPILVRDSEDEEWKRRYFAKHENGKVHAFQWGCTSWSMASGVTSTWNYAKLAEEETDKPSKENA